MTGSDLGTSFAPYPGAQTRFFTAPEDVVFYGGAGGGGKSLMGMTKYFQQLVVEHGRFKSGQVRRSKAWAIYLRRKTTDLEQMVDLSHEYFPNFDPKAKYNANTTTWQFPSCGGAKFTFDHCQHEKDKFKFKSSSWTYMFFDELTEFTETQFMYIQSRLRSVDPVLTKMLQVCAGSNPDGEGLLWVRDMFIEGKEPEKVYRTKVTLENGEVREKDSVFIPARLKDNPALYESGQYEVQLRGLPTAIQEAILNGNWYYASGAYLARVWDSKYHVCPNHAVPSGASIFRSMDYGYSKPGSCTWWYLDRDGVLTAFYNLYLTEHTPEMWAQRIREVEEEFGIWDDNNNMSRITGPLDLSCWDKAHSGTTISRRMWERGVRFYKSKKGPGSRLNSSVELISRMRARIKDPLFPNDRSKDKPLIRWMERCGAPIRTLPVLRPDPNNSEDVDDQGDDHCYDETRYMCAAKPLVPEKEQDPDEDEVDNVRDIHSGSGRIGVGSWARKKAG